MVGIIYDCILCSLGLWWSIELRGGPRENLDECGFKRCFSVALVYQEILEIAHSYVYERKMGELDQFLFVFNISKTPFHMSLIPFVFLVHILVGIGRMHVYLSRVCAIIVMYISCQYSPHRLCSCTSFQPETLNMICQNLSYGSSFMEPYIYIIYSFSTTYILLGDCFFINCTRHIIE